MMRSVTEKSHVGRLVREALGTFELTLEGCFREGERAKGEVPAAGKSLVSLRAKQGSV